VRHRNLPRHWPRRTARVAGLVLVIAASAGAVPGVANAAPRVGNSAQSVGNSARSLGIAAQSVGNSAQSVANAARSVGNAERSDGNAAPPVGNAAPRGVVPAEQELAVLLTTHPVVASLSVSPARLATLSAVRPITGEETTLPVTGQAVKDGTSWLRVMLPGRPNGAQGWIRQRGTRLETTRWQLIVETASRRVLVYHSGRLVRTFPAIVGKPSTPTPVGQFFVEESVRMPSGSAGAPFALALSARSRVLQDFDGGPGQIAIHGVTGLAGTLGTAVSHGCVRIANLSVAWLAARIGPGVPVLVRP
jgi:lipoprotein-anchoring transpeptidase ErfK/SrfK